MKKVSPLAKEKSVKADAAKTVAKKPVVKAEPVKAEPVKVEEFKQEKIVETEKTAPVVEKKEEKKPVEKKAVVKKPAEKKAVAEEVFIQFRNQEILTVGIIERVKAAYAAEGHDADSIEKVRVYIKPEENMVYYVVNDGYASGIKLF